jgi:DNA processing protein
MGKKSFVGPGRWEFTVEDLSVHWPDLVAASPDIKHLYAEGRVELLDRLPDWGLAVVGTRYPQPRSIQHLRSTLHQVSQSAQASQVVVVSGFARGIDRAAHEAAIEFGLPTIGILGSGLDHPYPGHHAELKAAILQSPGGGLLLSEHPWAANAYKSQFLARNRLIARWSKATWMVEASFKSGAMNTARWAREAERDCYTTPGFPGDPSLAGNEQLLDLYQANPVWGAHNFGQTWLTFSAQKTEERSLETDMTHLSKAARELYESICVREHAAGGADITSLFERSMAHGGSPPEFYQALDELLASKKIKEDRSGLLVTARTRQFLSG